MKLMNLINKYKTFAMIFVIAFFVYCSNQMINTTISKFAHYMGASASMIGMVSGSFAMMALVMRPFSGQAVDNLNKKYLLTGALSVILVATIGLSFANEVYLLVVFRGLNGLGWGIGSTLCMTLATSSFPKERMTTGIGIYSLGQTMAQAIAPSIGLQIVAKTSFNSLYRYNVMLMVIAVTLSFFIKIDEPAKNTKGFKFSFDVTKMIAVSAIMPASMTLCNGLATSSISAFLVLYAESLGVGNVGFYFTIQAFTLLACRPIISMLADKFGTNKVLIPCEILQIVALITIYSAQGTFDFVLAALFMGIATSGTQPTLMGLCVNSVEPEKRGIASNTSYVGTDIGAFVGANLAGFIVSMVGYRYTFIIEIIPILLCLTVYMFYIKKHPELIKK